MSVEAWVGHPVQVNWTVYAAWLSGASVPRASERRTDADGFPAAVVEQDSKDQYLLFGSLARLLESPPTIMHNSVYPLSTVTRQRLNNEYYGFDDVFMREVAGRSLSSRLRKDLDEVAEKTGLSIHNCRRQFDNLKRVFKAVEDRPGCLRTVIGDGFLLSDELARHYSRLVFMTGNRLAIDKKNIQHIRFEAFCNCAEIFMATWTSIGEPGGNDQDLDKGFLQELRELKYAFSSDVIDEQRQKLRQAMGQEWDALDPVFRNLCRGLFSIGAGLSHSKEFRDIYEDLEDKVIEPLRQQGVPPRVVGPFFEALRASFPGLTSLSGEARAFRPCYDRYLLGLQEALGQLYAPSHS